MNYELQWKKVLIYYLGKELPIGTYRWMGTVHRQICSTFAQLLLKFEAINTGMCTLHTVLDRYPCSYTPRELGPGGPTMQGL